MAYENKKFVFLNIQKKKKNADDFKCIMSPWLL